MPMPGSSFFAGTRVNSNRALTFSSSSHGLRNQNQNTVLQYQSPPVNQNIYRVGNGYEDAQAIGQTRETEVPILVSSTSQIQNQNHSKNMDTILKRVFFCSFPFQKAYD